MKKQNRFLAFVLALSLCLALALPAVAAGSPRIYETYDFDNIPADGQYYAVSGEVALRKGATVTVQGTWYPPFSSIWVGIVDKNGNTRSVLLSRSGASNSFTVPEEGYYTLQVSSIDYDIRDGKLLVSW